MLVSTTSQYDTPDFSIIDHTEVNPQLWLQYFDVRQAIADVAADVAALPSSTDTPEQHTKKVYEAGLNYFLTWADWRLPTPSLIQGFIAHLIHHKHPNRKLKSSTVNSKYLAPVRKYLEKLADQHIQVTGAEREFVQDCKELIRQAKKVKGPKPRKSTNIAPMWDPTKTRLTVEQVNAVLRKIDTDNLIGKRDYALLYVAFTTALRVAELSRITLNSISMGEDGYLITVRGKRSNYDPVPLGKVGYKAVMEWVSSYNAGLEDDDPRRISGDMPIWQAMIHGSNYGKIGTNRFNPERGMSIQGIRNMIERRAGIEPHDTRRTCGAILYDKGAPLPSISKLFRHADSSTTWKYIGQKPNHKDSTFENYVQIG